MISLNERRQKFKEETKKWHPEPIHKLFFRMADKYKNEDFIIFNQQKWSYSESAMISKRLAISLINRGLKQQSHISLILPNYPEFIFAKFGIAAAGGITVPLNYRLQKEELTYLINQSDSSYVIIIDKWKNNNYVDMMKELCPEVFRSEQSRKFPNLKEIIVFSPEGKKYNGTTDFYALIDNVKNIEVNSNTYNFPESKVTDVTDIMYTSGTTSMPKGVLVTHDMIWRSALGSCINRGYQTKRRIFVPIPFYHCFAYIEGIIAGSMVGGSLVLQVNFEASSSLGLIEEFGVNDILCVPTIGLKLAENQKRTPRNLYKLQSMYCAGAEVSKHMWKDIKESLNIKELNTGYGMTECAAGVLQTDPNDSISHLVEYVGRPIPGGHIGVENLEGKNITFKTVDIETGEEMGLEQEGELICKGPLVTNGYYNKEKETYETIDEKGWLKTGDLAVIHQNGYISLTGRIKEIYRMGGENVSPKEVEDILTANQLINQAYVIGVPDISMGEVGLAIIILEDKALVTEKDIFEYASEKLSRYKLPKYIKILNEEDLPMTPVGKVLKRELKDWFVNKKIKVKPQF